jgi:hypothetical protein
MLSFEITWELLAVRNAGSSLSVTGKLLASFAADTHSPPSVFSPRNSSALTCHFCSIVPYWRQYDQNSLNRELGHGHPNQQPFGLNNGTCLVIDAQCTRAAEAHPAIACTTRRTWGRELRRGYDDSRELQTQKYVSCTLP